MSTKAKAKSVNAYTKDYSKAMERITKSLKSNTIAIEDVEACIDAVFGLIEAQEKEIKQLKAALTKVKKQSAERGTLIKRLNHAASASM